MTILTARPGLEIAARQLDAPSLPRHGERQAFSLRAAKPFAIGDLVRVADTAAMGKITHLFPGNGSPSFPAVALLRVARGMIRAERCENLRRLGAAQLPAATA